MYTTVLIIKKANPITGRDIHLTEKDVLLLYYLVLGYPHEEAEDKICVGNDSLKRYRALLYLKIDLRTNTPIALAGWVGVHGLFPRIEAAALIYIKKKKP